MVLLATHHNLTATLRNGYPGINVLVMLRKSLLQSVFKATRDLVEILNTSPNISENTFCIHMPARA